MQNIVEGGDRFDHQKVADWRGLRRGDFTLINKTELGEELHGVFAGATGHALYPFLTRDGLRGHRHQRSQPLVLNGGMYCHKPDGGLVISIDIQTSDSDRVALFIDHHLMVRHGVPGVAL